MTLSKAQMVDELFSRNFLRKAQSARIVDILRELMKRSLRNGEDVPVSRIGKFAVENGRAPAEIGIGGVKRGF